MGNIREIITQYNEDALLADGFDDAIIGITRRINMEPVVAYDYDKCVEILMTNSGMEYEDAVEYMEYNVVGAWLGDHTPIFIDTSIRED